MTEVLTNLAARIDPDCRLDDVALSEQTRRELTQILESIRSARLAPHGQRATDDSGVTALFHGLSGSGKTMAALALARELGRHVIRIDLSRVISKYIGETEKNLDAVFRDAQQSSAVLLLEEADELFGKRSEVKDSPDRYANIEVACLLQRLEAYEGLAILTTNVRQSVEEAFVRRLRLIVEFPHRTACSGV
jgi:SpoVK/Ycf46/Vps4 family AAA+-type ATPase